MDSRAGEEQLQKVFKDSLWRTSVQVYIEVLAGSGCDAGMLNIKYPYVLLWTVSEVYHSSDSNLRYDDIPAEH